MTKEDKLLELELIEVRLNDLILIEECKTNYNAVQIEKLFTALETIQKKIKELKGEE